MEEWRTGTVLAWTEHDGPGRPPRGPHTALPWALAGTIGMVFSVMLFTDTLCPEHRAWVRSLAVLALAGTAVAIVGLIRQWASAAAWTLTSSVAGIAIGLLDAAHAPGRGRLIAAAFALVAVGAALLSTSQLRVARWERRVLRDTAAAEDRRPSDSGAGTSDTIPVAAPGEQPVAR